MRDHTEAKRTVVFGVLREPCLDGIHCSGLRHDHHQEIDVVAATEEGKAFATYFRQSERIFERVMRRAGRLVLPCRLVVIEVGFGPERWTPMTSLEPHYVDSNTPVFFCRPTTIKTTSGRKGKHDFRFFVSIYELDMNPTPTVALVTGASRGIGQGGKHSPSSRSGCGRCANSLRPQGGCQCHPGGHARELDMRDDEQVEEVVEFAASLGNLNGRRQCERPRLRADP